MNKKINSFEYTVYQLHNWYKEAYGSTEQNDLSILKVLKLLFFVSAVGVDKNSHNSLIDEVFDNFCAMPYGHVESDVYSIIKNKQLQNVKLNTSESIILNSNLILSSINEIFAEKINKSIKLLKEVNFDLIKLSSFELVELSHRWYSWQKNFNIAKSKGYFSSPIPKEEIKGEIKIYQL